MSQQKTSLEYMKRISASNCITGNLEDTYNLHAVGVELLVKKLNAGEKYIQPYVDMWEPHWGPRTIKMPKKIKTFMYSPFLDVISDRYIYPEFDNGTIRFSHGPIGDFMVKQKLAKKVKKESPQEYFNLLTQLNEKIEQQWGKVTKILVFYDYTRAEEHDAIRMHKYESIALNALKDWNVARAIPHFDPQYNPITDVRGPNWDGWEHYSKETIINLYNQIKYIEQNKCNQ